MQYLPGITAFLLQTIVTLITCMVLYALFSKALWYRLNGVEHEMEVIRSAVTREVKVRAADTRHSGEKMSAETLKTILALQAGGQNTGQLSREEIIEKGRRA